jgi:hypothetical protein
MKITDKDFGLLQQYQADWNKWIKEILGVRLTREQKAIVESVQHNPKTSVRSGHSVGKDYVAAAVSLAFLYLNIPSKVINTAPTGRQVINIMMAEIGKMYSQSKIPLGGFLLTDRIRFSDDTTHYLLGFKAGDTKYRDTESWTGFHSPNILVVVTEASGIEQNTFDAVEGILTGNSRLLLVFNPNRISGESYKSTRSPDYQKFALSCLGHPNIRARQTIVPGAVDYPWVENQIRNHCVESDEKSARANGYGFKWNSKWHIPDDWFLVRVLGEFPRTSEDTLIPLKWVELANERWKKNKPEELNPEDLRLGVDIAGQGRDSTIFVPRYGNYVAELETHIKSGKTEHMVSAGRIKNKIEKGGYALIDTIGEGAGVYSRLAEQNIDRAISAKFSAKAQDNTGRDLTDVTGERTFINMRAYCYWAIRDALDPAQDGQLALPPDPLLTEELTEISYFVRSDGKIQIEKKEDKGGIKDRLGRSPDRADGLAESYYPIPVTPQIWIL